MDCYDRLYKVIIIGDSNVGKSTLLLRYCDGEFVESQYISTIGVDFRIKTTKHNGLDVKLQVWDTAGQERFRNIVNSYYRGAHAVVVCFDLTDSMTLQSVIDTWLPDVERFTTKDPRPAVVLVGTKCDLKQQVPEEDIQKVCEEYNMTYVKTSAKTGQGCEEIFESIMDRLSDRINIPRTKAQVPQKLTGMLALTSSRNCCSS